MVSEFLVGRALDEHHISHGEIRLVHRGFNDSYSDGENVFCKVVKSRGGRGESVGLSLAKECGRSFGVPLLPDPVDVSTTSMSIWKWRSVQPLRPKTILPYEASLAADELVKIHRVEANGAVVGKMIEPRRLAAKIRRRVENATEYGRASKEHLNTLMELSDRFFIDFSKPVVLSHGDAHIGNAAVDSERGNIFWFDFENAKMAAAELDFATMQVSLLNAANNELAWDAASEVIEDSGADMVLVNDIAVMRMISLASGNLLTNGGNTLFEARVESLSVLLDDSDSIVAFPRNTTW